MIPLWYGKANLVYHPLDLFEPGVRKATHIAFTVAEAEALIDPNDPAVRERVIQALAEDVDDRWHLPAADLEAVAHEMTDAVLAALRGAK